jgi:hypothetical protein
MRCGRDGFVRSPLIRRAGDGLDEDLTFARCFPNVRPRRFGGRHPDDPTCATGPWPTSVEGRPATHTDAEGVYLWHTSRGWHLRVNDPGADRAVFTGSVRVDGRIVSIGRHLENAGEGIVYPSTAGVVGFRFVNYGGVDGLDFVTRCASTVSVRVKVDGTTVAADHVYVGADGHHPDAVPTTVGRA